ncbi:MAG: FAD-dependent oxidoreductase [Actinomycetota bacterium]|nr:FAD-dependent oxidoreductase [Actinomycetota bacterium]
MPQTTSAQESLWLATSRVSDYAPLEGKAQVDVAVLGGGIAGLTAALLLRRDGARVAVLEAGRVGTGVTGCTTAKVSALQGTVYSEIRRRRGEDAATCYGQASLAGVERVVSLAAEERIDCELERRPAFTYAAHESERATVEEEAGAAAAAGLPVGLVETTDLPYAVHGAVVLDRQVQFHPVQFTQGLAAAVHGDGSCVYELTRATSVSEGSPCHVYTEHGEIEAEQVVVATHYPILDRGLYFARLKPQRSYCIAARVSGSDTPAGMSISAGSPTRSVRSRDDLLIVGGEGHTVGSSEATPERFSRLEEFARQHWSVTAVGHRWSAHDLMPYDHLPMIGAYHPRSTRLWVSTGFLKWGLASATFAAMILADRIAGRESPWAEVFSPNRVSPRATPAVAGLGLKFTADMVGDRLRPPQSLSAADVTPGEGRVLRDGLGKKGVYRAEDGTLHAVSLRCTHLGCLLRFNGAERSWDCPCHGSRFGVDGSVLEGPAVRPLRRREP